MSEVADRRDDHRGAIARALLWVVGGLVLTALVLVAVAPEVVRSDPRVVVELSGLVVLAGVPGIVLLVVAAIRRKRMGLDDLGHDPSARPGFGKRPGTHTDEDR